MMASIATALLAASAACEAGAEREAGAGRLAAGAAGASFDTADLARRSLSASSLPQMQLLATPAGRDVLAHVVACALPQGAAITTITRDGTPYSFSGRLGLAPDWAHHAPAAREHQRVAACVRIQIVGLTEA
jgi:hypothetical protein